jgi:hypothetical protein
VNLSFMVPVSSAAVRCPPRAEHARVTQSHICDFNNG